MKFVAWISINFVINRKHGPPTPKVVKKIGKLIFPTRSRREAGNTPEALLLAGQGLVLDGHFENWQFAKTERKGKNRSRMAFIAFANALFPPKPANNGTCFLNNRPGIDFYWENVPELDMPDSNLKRLKWNSKYHTG